MSNKPTLLKVSVINSSASSGARSRTRLSQAERSSPFKLPFEENHGLLKIRTSDLKANASFFPAQPFADVVLSSAFGWFVSETRRE
jgi:hypothetical protein